MLAFLLFSLYICTGLMKEVTSKTLYVSDMDGTLMGADSRLSQRTVDILNDLIARQGLLFTVATARTTATVVPLMQAVHATLPFIILSGAALWNPVERRIEQVQAIPAEEVTRACAIFERHGVRPFVYRQHGNVIHTHHYGTLSQVEHEFVEARRYTPYKHFLLGDASYHTSDDATMLIFAMSHGNALEQIYHEVRQQVHCSPILYYDNNDKQLALLEVYAEGCNKAAAVRCLSQQVGADRVVAFGDNNNDLPMLQAADHGVAVANAVPALLTAADEVIGPNTDDSVAQYLMNNV